MIKYLWPTFLCILMVAGATTTYRVKYNAGIVTDQANHLTSEIAGLEEQISRLKAQWSLLNQPARLQALVENNQEALPLVVPEPYQIGNMSDVPEPSALARIIPRSNPLYVYQPENDIATLINGADEPTVEDLINARVQ